MIPIRRNQYNDHLAHFDQLSLLFNVPTPNSGIPVKGRKFQFPQSTGDFPRSPLSIYSRSSSVSKWFTDISIASVLHTLWQGEVDVQRKEEEDGRSDTYISTIQGWPTVLLWRNIQFLFSYTARRRKAEKIKPWLLRISNVHLRLHARQMNRQRWKLNFPGI